MQFGGKVVLGDDPWTDNPIKPGPIKSLNLSVSVSPVTTEHDTDSDSDLSLEDDQSGSYASTHSSDSEEDEDFSREPCWENLLCPNNEKLPAHSTPKGNSRLTTVPPKSESFNYEQVE